MTSFCRCLVAGLAAILAMALPAAAQQANLVRNGGWSLAVPGDEARRAGVAAQDAHEGRQALFLDAMDLGTEVGAWSEPIPVEAGRRYRLAVWVKQTAGYSQYKAVIDWRDAAGRHLDYANNWRGNDCPAHYQEQGGEYIAPPGAAQAVLLLGVASGSACRMDSISLAPLDPVGPRLKAYLFCGQRDAAGRMAVQARVQNEGDRPSERGKAVLDVPPGLQADAVEQPMPALAPGARCRLEWGVAGTPSGPEAPLRVRALAEGCSAEAATRPFLARGKTVRTRSRGVPKLRPAASDLEVGTYYFPVMLDWGRAGWGVRRVDYLNPLLGYYDESLPEVADWHIKWAAEHGIDFFAFDWYYNDGTLYLNDALEKGFLRSRYLPKTRFCIHWCNEGHATWDRPLNYSTEALCEFMAYLCRHYFRSPSYLRVDGKPLVMIIRPDPILEWHGGTEGSRRALDAMRQVARRFGHPDVYLMCIGLAERSDLYRRAGWDAITAYSYGWGDAPRYANRDADYEDLVPEHERAWESSLRHAGGAGLGYMPVVWSGWDDYARANQRAVRTRGNTPARFRAMCETAARYVDPALNLLTIEAWNEWGEGGYLEPSRERGFSFLDAIRDVFTRDRGAHRDDAPSLRQVARYETQLTFEEIHAGYVARDRRKRGIRPVTRLAWEFNREGDLERWHLCAFLAPPKVAEGCWQSRSASADPAMLGPAEMEVDAREYRALEVRMRVDGGGSGQLFWRAEGAHGFTEEAGARFALTPDGGFHVYRIALAENPHWRGLIRQMRLDPTDQAGATVAVDYIRGTK